MRFLAITHKGLADITLLEISEILGAKGKAFSNYVTFDTENLIDACRFAYMAQSVRHVIALLGSFSLKGPDDIQKVMDAGGLIREGISFAVKAIHDDDHPFSMSDIEAKIGEKILEGHSLKVDLENPDISIAAFLSEGNCHIGVDLSGFDLSKRSYYLFNHSTALRGTIAYSMLRIAGYAPKDTIADPFAIAGYIPIEAGIYATGRSPHFFVKDRFSFNKIGNLDDKQVQKMFIASDRKERAIAGKIIGYDEQLRRVKSAQKNAKLAGLKDISFGRGEIEWLDTKFDEGEIDHIVTYPPQFSKRSDEKQVQKAITELFYQADYVLSKKGNVVLVCTTKEKYIDAGVKYNFRLESEREAYQGKEKLNILVFSKDIQSPKKEPALKHTQKA